MNYLTYAALVNQDGDDEQSTAIMAALAQGTPASRLAVYHNASLNPQWRIDRASVAALDEAYARRDADAITMISRTTHALRVRIAESMLEDLEGQGREGYLPPWWASLG